MMLKAHSGGWSLFLLAAVISGVHSQRNNSSVQPVSDSVLPSKTQIYRPVLQPSEAIPLAGTYILKGPGGKTCIKATMGVEYIVTEKKKTWFFSLDPSRVRASGYCGKEAAVLSLTLPDSAASLRFTFRKENTFFYVTNLTAHVFPQPACEKCANKVYAGLLDHEKLFTTANGQSFMCMSESLLLMSPELKIKLVPLQIQAFNMPTGEYGKVVHCWADFNKQVLPIIIGAIVVGLFLITVLTFLFIKDRRRPGYEQF